MQVAAIFALSVLVLVNTTLPATVESLARSLGFSPALQGAFSSADYLGAMIGALSAIVFMRYASARRTVVLALLLLLFTDLGSVVWRWNEGLLALRFIGGFATGLGGGACGYVFGLKDSARMAGIVQFAMNGLSLVVISAMPVLTNSLGWRGIFLCFAVLTLPALLLSRAFPSTYSRAAAVVTSLPSYARPSAVILVLLGLAGAGLHGFGTSLIWSLLGRIGAEAGFTEKSIAASLAVSIICACAGAVVAIVYGDRLGLKTFVAANIVTALGVAATGSVSPWTYSAAVSAFNCGVTVYWAAAFGFVMRNAPTGRFAVQMGGVMAAMSVAGPAVGGFIVGRWGFAVLRGVGASTFVLCGIAFVTYFYFAYCHGARAKSDCRSAGDQAQVSKIVGRQRL